MSIFISWSKGRSLVFAKALRDLLGQVLRDTSDQPPRPRGDLVTLSEDLPKGGNWFQNLAGLLENSKAGILCVTPENRSSPWLLFEAGALIRCDVEVALFPVLFDLPATSLEGPLSLVQSTILERDIASIKRETYALLTRVVEHVNQVDSESSLYITPPDPGTNDPWEEFATRILQIEPASVTAVCSEFPAIFERKTFQEPFHECADQRWLDRYAGARTARDVMDAHKEQVRAALPRGAQLAFERLRSAVDSYAMAIAGQLLEERTFAREDDGRLKDFEGRLAVCERRRRMILSAYSRLRDPIAPVFDDARLYEELPDLQERKVRLIHPLEQRLDAQLRDGNSNPAVAFKWQLARAATSPWLYDRLVFYVHAARASDSPTLDELLSALDREVSLLEARDEPASLVGLYYALEAAENRGVGEPGKKRLVDTLDRVQACIEEWNKPPQSAAPGRERVDASGKVRKMVQRLRQTAS